MKHFKTYFCILFLLISSFAYAQKSCEEYFAQLEAILNKSYEAPKNPALPQEVRFGLDDRDPKELFQIFNSLWRDTVDKKQFRKTIASIAKDGQVDEQAAKDVKLTRAKLKQLRFAYMSFGRKHEYPKALDKLTVALGRMQDAFKFSKPEEIRDYAKEVQTLLSSKKLDKLDQELKAFRPDDPAGLATWQKGELTKLRELILQDELPAKRFHEARKIVSRQTGIFFVLNTVHPTQDRQAAMDYLSNLAEEMGLKQDAMVEKAMTGQEKYEAETQKITPGLRNQVLNYIDHFQVEK
jgi:hypothetical protein